MTGDAGRTAVFGYGSLVSAASAGETIGRPVERVIPAVLAGHVRRFSLARDNHRCEKTFARLDGSIPAHVLAMNLEPAASHHGPRHWPNGGLIELGAGEPERLDVREIRYRRIDVTRLIETEPRAPRFDHVFTYVALDEHLAGPETTDAVVLRSYAEAIERAFESLGPGELDRYRATTPIPSEPIEATLVRDEIPPGNPRDW